MDFEVGVYMDPIFFGQFPDSVRARLPYLPEITPKLVSTNGHIIDQSLATCSKVFVLCDQCEFKCIHLQ